MRDILEILTIIAGIFLIILVVTLGIGAISRVSTWAAEPPTHNECKE